MRKVLHSGCSSLSCTQQWSWHNERPMVLQEASDKGFFRPEGKPNMAAILNVAAQVADGMAFLHARGVAHGDLTGGNVLLASDPASPSGVTAKIADFGLARSLGVQSKIETHTYGTVTHMPPELLTKGMFSKVGC